MRGIGFVWVQDIGRAVFEPLADFLPIALAGVAHGFEGGLTDGTDHGAELTEQAGIQFLQGRPAAHHQIPDGHGELASDGGDGQVEAALGGQQLAAPAAQGTLAGAQNSLGALHEQGAQHLVAMAADALQIFVFPLFAEGALSPADDVLDLAVAAVLVNLLWWHWEFLPAFAAELVPGVDLVPFWTLAVANVYRKWKHITITQEAREQHPALPKPPNFSNGI